MKKFFHDCGTRDATASLGILVLRAATGIMMLVGHGIPKLQNYAKLSEKFYVPELFPFNKLSPQVSLIGILSAEVLAAGLLVIGFATRPAAFVFAFAMVVAAFGAHADAPWFTSPTAPAAKELALLYLLPAVVLILTGAGSFSADAMMLKDSKRRRW